MGGFFIKVYGVTDFWSSKKQLTVATSSSEAEYATLSSTVSEVIWAKGIMEDLRQKIYMPMKIYEDIRVRAEYAALSSTVS